VAQSGLVDHVDVRRRALVVHAPTAINEFELPGLDDASHLCEHPIRLLLDPALKKGLLDKDEFAVRVLEKRGEDRVDL
jgi:hypothetical protein